MILFFIFLRFFSNGEKILHTLLFLNYYSRQSIVLERNPGAHYTRTVWVSHASPLYPSWQVQSPDAPSHDPRLEQTSLSYVPFTASVTEQDPAGLLISISTFLPVEAAAMASGIASTTIVVRVMAAAQPVSVAAVAPP